MQSANLVASSSSRCSWDWVGGPPEPDEVVEVERLTFATPGLEPPPQPATKMAAAAMAVLRMSGGRQRMVVPSVERRKGDVDSQTATRTRVCGDGCAVSARDRLDDREPE